LAANVAALAKILLGLLLLMGAAAAVLWMGLLTNALSPLGPLSLEKQDQWFVDAKLAALRFDPALCRAVLDRRFVDAASKPDRPLQEDCGWTNSVEFTEIGGVKLPVYVLTCEMTAALALWIRHEVQPAAKSLLGSSVAKIDHFGTYSCRNVAGRQWRSQHAAANAIDVSGFTLEDSRTISVLRHWQGNSSESRFLRRVHDGACRYFRLTLGPAYNAAHADHFHVDRGLYWGCR
jgi:hypothetical protein